MPQSNSVGRLGEIVDSPGSPSLSQGRGLIPGLIEEGNIDLYAQPVVQNPDGSTSTVDSVGWEEEVDGRTVHVLVPQVTPDGRHFTDPREAWEEYKRTGLHLGKFESQDASDAYGGQLHDEYASGLYDRRPQ